MGKLQVWHTPTGLWSYSQRTQARGCHLYVLPQTHYVSLVSLKKELIHLSRALDFYDCHPGETSRLPSSSEQRGLCLWSHRTRYICIL